MPVVFRPAGHAASRRGVWILVCAACALAGLGGCFSAPLVQPVTGEGPSAFADLPRAERVKAETIDGTTLRGLFLRAEPETADPFVVLHLLPSGVSVTDGMPMGLGRTGLARTLEALSGHGFGSVVFDYRGLGDSEGPRDSSRLLEDGRAMWARAVELAGGREERVVIRAGSLGTLIAADVLGRGAEPAGVVLFAPVRARTLVRHAAREHRGVLASWLAPLIYRGLGAPSLEKVLAGAQPPVLLFLPRDDPYLPADERARVENTARRAGHTVEAFASTHQALILRSWNFELDPEEFSGREADRLLGVEDEFLRSLREDEALSGP